MVNLNLGCSDTFESLEPLAKWTHPVIEQEFLDLECHGFYSNI